MKHLFLTFIFLPSWLLVFAQEKVNVFTSGTEGYDTYRIPAIIMAPNGDLLAFCEGRLTGSGDFGDIDIVMKRSSDHGKTWSSLHVVAEAGTLQAGNPAPVVDLSDPSWTRGRIFLFYNTGNNHENEVRKGKGLREVWYKTSTDNGHTWSAPVNITSQVHRPFNTDYNPSYSFPEDWRSFANTPGHAMQFHKGKYMGRIYVAANHSAGDPQENFRDYRAFGYYTDDHGKTFQISEDVDIPGSNESTAAELANGWLMMNSRNQAGDIRARIVSLSSDGGTTWDTTYFDMTLIDPVCEGSLLNAGKNLLAFSNAAHEAQRDNLTLRISDNDGKTWKKSLVIDRSPDMKSNNFTAYSDIIKLPGKKIGILYEKEAYTKIVFTSVTP